MKFTIYKTFFLCLAGLSLCGAVQAQRIVASDSIALFYGIADEQGGQSSPPVLKTKGYISVLQAQKDGIEIGHLNIINELLSPCG